MQLKKVSDYSLRLDFLPRRQVSNGGIAHAARGVLLSGFDLTPNHPVVDHGDLTSNDLLKLWKDLYPQLTVPEKCRLSLHPLRSDFPFLQQVFPQDADFTRLSELVSRTNQDCQNWLSDKNFGLSELLVFIDLTQSEIEMMISTSRKNLESRQMAALRFELTQELKLMGNAFETIHSLDIEQLKSLRYPNTFSRDQDLKNKFMHWPQKIKAKAHRRGDQMGFDVQFFAGTPVELEKISEQLKKVATQWNSDQTTT